MSARFGIVGAGSLGQIFAAALAAKGHQVTVLATPRGAEALRAAGAIRVHGALDLEVPLARDRGGAFAAALPRAGGRAEAPGVGRPPSATEGGAHARPAAIAVTTDPAELPADAAVVFTPKGHNLPEAIEQVRKSWRPGPDAWVCGVQNGIVKDDLLAAAFGPERVVGAVTITGGQREADGRVACTSPGATFLGEFSDEPSARADAAAAALSDAGLPTQAVTNIRTVLWSKMCNAAGLFAATCLSQVTSNRFGHYPDLVRAYMGLIRETAAIAAAQGIPMGDYPGFPIKTYLSKSDDEVVAYFKERAAPFAVTPGAPESRTSMLQDLLAGRPLEVDAIYGDLAERAARLGVAAPRLTLARDLVRAIDPARQPKPKE